MRKTLASEFRRLRKARGLTQKQLAKLAGVSQSTVGNIESGYRGVSGQIPASLPRLIPFLGVDTNDFLERVGMKAPTPRAYDQNVAIPASPPSVRAVPIVAWIEASELAQMETPSPLEGDGVVWVEADYGPLCIALVIEGDSMEPEFREGDLIIVDPDITPLPGDFVVARNAGREATFKKYRPRGGSTGIFELAPLNDDYPTLRSDQDGLTVLGVMVEHRKRRRR